MATRSIISKSIAESASTYVGVAGELILDTSTNTLKISDGSSAGGVTLTTEGSGGVTATSTTTFTNKSGAISQWTNDAFYWPSNSASIAPQQVNASGSVNAIGMAMRMTGHGLQIGDGTTGDDTTFRIIFEADADEGDSTEIFAKRSNDGQGSVNFWFPKFDATTRYLVTTGTVGGLDADHPGMTGNLDTWFDPISFSGNTISTNASNADLELDASGTGAVSILTQKVFIKNLPTSDPGVLGQLYTSGSDMKISQG